MNEASIPKSWAAAGRLRVACFLVGLFDTLVDYMSRDEYNSLAACQSSFLYSEARKSGRLDQFWDAVLTKALEILSDNKEIYTDWVGIDRSSKRQKGESTMSTRDADNYESVRPTNGDISMHIKNLLRGPIQAFLFSSNHKAMFVPNRGQDNLRTCPLQTSLPPCHR